MAIENTENWIKKYSELSDDEVQKLFQFARKFQNEGFYEDISAMKAYYGGALMGRGEQHLSLWQSGAPVASCGWIDKEVAEKQRLFLSHAFAEPSEEYAHWEMLLAEIFSWVSKVHGVNVKTLEVRMGIRGEDNTNGAESWAKKSGWSPLFCMLKMSLTLKTMEPCGGDTKGHIPLILRPLAKGDGQWMDFLRIHNDGFEQVPNGGLLEPSEELELIQTYEENAGMLWLIYDEQRPVAIAMVAVDLNKGIGELEALAVDPRLHGSGYGRRALKAVVAELRNLGHRSVELMVMNSNKRAYGLYLSEGFKLDRTEVRWYQNGVIGACE